MKFKKASVFSLVFALALVSGVSAVFATTAEQETDEQEVGVDFYVFDEEGNKIPVSDAQAGKAQKFFFDEDGKLVSDPDGDPADPLSGYITFYNLEYSDLLDYSFSVTPEDIASGALDLEFARTEFTEEELQQIIADIESGKIKVYPSEDLENGSLPEFDVPEGAEVSVSFSTYSGNDDGVDK